MDQQLRKMIRTARSISITADPVTAKASKIAYLVITAHWVTSDFKPQSATLGVREFIASHEAGPIIRMVVIV